MMRRARGWLAGVLGVCAASSVLACDVAGLIEKAARQAGKEGEGASGRAAGAPSFRERTRQVDFVWYREGSRGPEGGTSAAKVILKLNPSGDVRVAVFEEVSGGAGSMWRASVWVASFLATQALGKNLNEFEIGVSTGGLVDGPSAGALTTAALMAAILDHPVRPDATMTGTINPDGSVGPVGGIPQKMEGAARKGKKWFGYPVGQRYDFDLEQRRLVDLHAVAQGLGLQVKELRDLYDAYELLTGRRLPRPEPLAASQLEVSPAFFERIQAKTTAWLAKVESKIAQLRQQRRGVDRQMLLRVAKAYEDAKRHQAQGMVPVAYLEALQAAAGIEVAARIGKLFSLASRLDLRGMLLEVQSLQSVSADLGALVAQLRTEQPRTVSKLLALLAGYTMATQAWALVETAGEQLQQFQRLVQAKQQGKLRGVSREQFLGAIVQRLAAAVLYYRLAGLMVEATQDFVSAASRDEGPPMQLDPEKVERLAQAYTSAAKANLDYYESIVLEQEADRVGVSLARVREAKASQDVNYLVAFHQVRYALMNRERKDLHSALARLGAALGAYVTASVLVSKEYSLGAQTNEQGEVVRVRRDKAFIAMLELAEQNARRQAARVQAVYRLVPDLVRFQYQLGRSLREGTPDEKIQALDAFWTASAFSELAVRLAQAVR